MKEVRQCSSCGGFCKKSGCERANVGFGPPNRGIIITEDSLKAIQKEVEVQTYAADNYRRLLDESDHAYAGLKDASMQLRGEARVMRVLLEESLNVIATLEPEDDNEHARLESLKKMIVAVVESQLVHL